MADPVRRAGLKPWKVDTSNISNDPQFEEKPVDVVGPYMNPRSRAQIRALEAHPSAATLDEAGLHWLQRSLTLPLSPRS